MASYQHTPALADVQTWANDGSPIPAWVQAQVVGEIAPNGTFLISTPLGSSRVHIGDVVIKHSSGLWSRMPGEISEFVRGLDAEASTTITAIGPGKLAQFGAMSKAGSGKSGRRRGGERKMAFRAPVGSMPSIEWVHTLGLAVDQSYQRSIDNEGSRRLIASIAANFDWRLCAPLVVSRRPDGSKIIIDGQHRWAAAVRRGDLPQLPCCLFAYASPEDEARMFIVANRARKAMNRLEDFHAAIAATDEDALEILRLVTDAGLKMARNTSSTAWRPGEVAFTSSIAAALRRHDSGIVSAALTSLAEAFKGQPLIHGGSVFGALLKIFANPPEDFDPDKLIPALCRFDMMSVGSIVQDHRSADARAAAIHTEIVEAMANLEESASGR